MNDEVLPLGGSAADAPSGAAPHATAVDAGDSGYQRGLKRRHLTMIAIGGSIGTGLFLGASGRMEIAGPSLAFVYIICGIFAFLVVRALGELVMYRPSSGAFVSYAREFMGEKGAYAVGWLYFLNWSTTVIADITAVALYMHFWAVFVPIPQWLLALTALAIVFAMNVASVKLFGEMEYWFAIIKVGAIVAFGVIGIFLVVTQTPVDGRTPGFQLITENGGFFPNGVGAMFVIALGVVFAFGGTEMVGVAAGESENPRAAIPRAVNSIMWRIVLFYAGSVILFTLLLPWNAYSGSESPFVTVMNSIGIPYAGDIMNVVVLTAAMSSLNAGLYATGRTLRSMAVAGTAPAFAKRLNASGAPYGGIMITAAIGVLGVGLNFVVPARAFDIVLNLAGIGIVGTWASIMVCHALYVRRTRRTGEGRPAYRLPFASVTNAVTLVFLIGIVVLMALDAAVGQITLIVFAGVVILMVIGWFAVRGRINASAFTAAFSIPDAAFVEQDQPGDGRPGDGRPRA
ncbi:amino acid permease [Leucobacter chromiiresistens]|uniref:Asparagine:proton symporter, AAT family n=1 Tax=Leucobacter chromiiresistens TaxID=1079994 RepID=A0A1H1BRN0_9MICO|nr:amino acid permease [Leucobacter chromiiresistens]SDQ54577.1 asparagine:proton symporter, AAT family [Leucobacter chromiiresistens]